MNGIKLISTGSAVPKKVVTNDDLAKIVDTNDEWISTRTGRMQLFAEMKHRYRVLKLWKL